MYCQGCCSVLVFSTQTEWLLGAEPVGENQHPGQSKTLKTAWKVYTCRHEDMQGRYLRFNNQSGIWDQGNNISRKINKWYEGVWRGRIRTKLNKPAPSGQKQENSIIRIRVEVSRWHRGSAEKRNRPPLRLSGSLSRLLEKVCLFEGGSHYRFCPSQRCTNLNNLCPLQRRTRGNAPILGPGWTTSPSSRRIKACLCATYWNYSTECQ